MKYDSGMTHFKNDIIAAIKQLLISDKEITKKFKADDGSPAPLREYLKEQYGKAYRGYRGDGVGYNCRSTGMILRLDTILNNLGDKELTLSWSQVAKFIRDNWKEIFMDKPTYREALKQQLPELTDDMINRCTCCPGSFFDDDNVPFCGTCGYEGNESLCPACWNKPCEGTYNGEPFDPSDWEDDSEEDQQKSDFPCDNCAHDVQGCCDYPDTADDYCVHGDKQVPVNSADETQTEPEALPEKIIPNEINQPAKFDYSELDAYTAKSLRECEEFILRKTSGYFTELGRKFKEAQTLLASHSAGTFEKWYTSVGFKRQTVYNLIDRYEFLSSPTVGGREEIFEALPLTLSYEISKSDAPAELVNKVLDGDITSNAEYQKMKAELEEANKRAENAERREKIAKGDLDILSDSNRENHTKFLNEQNKNQKLEKRIKELESRPVDVAVQQDDKLLKEIERLKSENEQLKNNEPEPIDGSTKTFLIRITMDDLGRLAELTEKDPLLHSKVMHAQIIRL